MNLHGEENSQKNNERKGNDKEKIWREIGHLTYKKRHNSPCAGAGIITGLALTPWCPPEPLLPGRVPQLQLDLHPRLHVQRPGIEIHPHRGVRHIAVHAVREPFQQRGLPHRRVSQ